MPPDERREAPPAGGVRRPQGRSRTARATPGDFLYDAKNDGIGVSQGHNLGDRWAAGTQELLNKALAGMKDGSLKTCPDKCGTAG